MQLSRVVAGLTLCVIPALVLAEPAPVSDLSDPLAQRVKRLEQQFAQNAKLLVDNQQLVTQLQQDLNALRGALEVQANEVDQILQRQRELYKELDRLSGGGVKVAAAPVASDGNAATLSESAAYERAINLILKEKKYAEAIPLLQQFIADFPESTHSANAHYWLGQLLFNQGDRNGARERFETVVNQYSDSSKRADAMLKLGILAQLEGNPASAKALYQRVISEYGSSSSAQIARARLDSLK